VNQIGVLNRIGALLPEPDLRAGELIHFCLASEAASALGPGGLTRRALSR
jgi:hypothetical protein